MENERIKLATNRSLILTESHRFWMVTSGVVEVFCVKVDENQEFTSNLKYLYSARKGELLFSLITATERTGYKLLLKSKEASLLAVNKNKLLDIDHYVLRSLIEKWILKNTEEIISQNPPRVHDTLDEQGTYELRKGVFAYPTKGIVWGLVEDGEVFKYGQSEETSTKQEFNHFFPISNHMWVQTLSNKTRLNVLSTQEALQDEIFFMLALNEVQDYFYQQLVRNIKDHLVEEADLLQGKVDLEENTLSKTLEQIKSIVDGNIRKKKIFSPVDNMQVNNLLFKACQLIGDVIDFEFSSPKYLETYQNSTTNQLLAIAQASKVRVRKIILRGVWWKDENGHLLAFKKDTKEPVALIQKSSNQYLLKNPSTDEEVVVNHKVAEELEPVSYMFFYGFDQQMTSVKKMVEFGIQGIKKDASYMILAALAGSILGLVVPIFSGIIFDDVIPTADKTLHIEVFILLVMVAIVTAGLSLTQGILRIRVETKSNVNLQSGVMDHLMRLPVSFYKQYSAGDLTNRALSINTIRQILSNTVLSAVLSGAFSFVNIILLFYYNVQMAFIGLGLAFIAVIFVTAIGWMKLKFDRQISAVQGDLQGFLYEFLSGISKIRNTAGEKRIFSLWSHKFTQLKQLGFNSGTYQNLVEIFNRSYPLLTSIVFFSFIYYNVISMNESIISVGAFIAFLAAFNQFLADALKMSLTLVSSLNVVSLYERVKPILEEIPESSGESLDPGELSGDIEMNSISFRYHEEQSLILNDVSFKVKPGEMVAFVGPSGSGKSTIMRLLLGFEEAEAGSVYYDGESFESMNKDLVRRQIGVVLQNGVLMAGSIYQNIVGNSELTLEDAWEAARLAGIDEDIKNMPMEMHTVISEGGSTFSGGQRQRLMIARAIVHKPRLIFMDEATSALDNRTQAIVSESLEKLQATRVVIAHRLSTIEKADRIYVLDKGKIVEFGSFDDLMKQDGMFAKLARRQIA